MRCDCCNNILSDREATRKFALSGEYTNTCDNCLSHISDVPTITRKSVVEEEDDDDLFYEDDFLEFPKDDDDE
mgnify:CR=1 FL=1